MTPTNRTTARDAAPLTRRAALGLLATGPLLGCSTEVAVGPEAIRGQRPTGTVEFRMFQAAYIGSGSGGSGTLDFNGRRHRFNIVSGGVGGFGASQIEGIGEVYNLHRLEQFPGAYAQARYGFALGTESAGDLWLQNETGVIMRVRARRSGLMLSVGADAVVIQML